MNTNNQIKRTKASDARRQLKQAILFCFIYLLAPGSVFSQENVWENKPKGENPWANYETVEKEETSTEVTVTEKTPKEETQENEEGVIVSTKVTSTEVFPNEEVNSISDVASKSTSTVRYFKLNDQEIKLNTNSFNYYSSLKHYGKTIHDGTGSLVGGIVTGSIVNFMALPVNLTAAFIPTHQTMSKIQKFKEDNPHATEKEVKAVEKGIRHKRLKKAVIGNIIGIGINIGVFIVLIIA